MSEPKKGFVYVLSNSAYNGLYKIGNSIELNRRIKDLSRPSGVPSDFEIVYKREFKDCVKIEKLAHEKFKNKRFNPKREFFKVSSLQIIEYLDEVAINLLKQDIDNIETKKNQLLSTVSENSKYKLNQILIEHLHKIQLESYKEYNQLLINKEELKKWWKKLGITIKVQILKRKTTRIGAYITYLTKQELIFAIEELLQYDIIPNNLFEISPYQKELNESNIIEIAKAIFPVLKDDYPSWYQKVTGKEALEMLNSPQLASILQLKAIKLKTQYDNIWIDLAPLVNLNTISINFEVNETAIQCLRGFPHLDNLIIHKIKFSTIAVLNQLNHIPKISFIISLSKKQIEEGVKQRMVNAFPKHKCYLFKENLKFGRQKWKVYFELK